MDTYEGVDCKMTKSREQITRELTGRVHNYTSKIGTFGCPEVTIGDERVDYLTLELSTGIWRFYEVKSCKEDFYSNAKWTFLGQFNYFVMNEKLYLEVKDDIPDHVGVTNGYMSFKRAKKQDLQIDSGKLERLMFRSLHTQYRSARRRAERLEWDNKCLRETLEEKHEGAVL